MSSASLAWQSRARAKQVPPAASSNTGGPSEPRSNGEPDPKPGSTTSNEATAGTAPNSPASMAPEPGAGTAYSHTPSSRWALSQRETGTTAEAATPDYHPQPAASNHADYFR